MNRIAHGLIGKRLAAFVVALCLPLAAQAIANSWSAGGNLATARALHTATLLSSGKVLVAGGQGGGGALLVSAELYDPATNTWSAAGSLANTREFQTATLLPSGKVLVAGGLVSLQVSASAELYDPVSNTWGASGSLATARFKHTATLLLSGKVLVAGGLGLHGILASAELYDPASTTWSTAGSLTTARYEHTATLLASGQVLVAGGAGAGASAELYDPSSNTWSAAGNLATARELHTATLLASGKVLVTGGTDAGNNPLASAELYDPGSHAWGAAGSLATARVYHTATLLPSGQVLVAGGFDAGALASAELYDPTSTTWSATDSLITARYWHTATLLSSGQVLVAGGADSNGNALASAELYSACGATQVSLSLFPLTASVSEAILFSAQADIGAPFAGVMSFAVDGGSATCTANMDDVNASCTHTLPVGVHSVVARYSGDGQNPSGCSAAGSVTVVPDTTQTPTTCALTSTPNPAMQGQPAALGFTCQPSASSPPPRAMADNSTSTTLLSGYATFSYGPSVIAYVPLANNDAAYSLVMSGGTFPITATYSGDSTHATTTNTVSVVVNKPADDLFYDGFEIVHN